MCRVSTRVDVVEELLVVEAGLAGAGFGAGLVAAALVATGAAGADWVVDAAGPPGVDGVEEMLVVEAGLSGAGFGSGLVAAALGATGAAGDWVVDAAGGAGAVDAVTPTGRKLRSFSATDTGTPATP